MAGLAGVERGEDRGLQRGDVDGVADQDAGAVGFAAVPGQHRPLPAVLVVAMSRVGAPSRWLTVTVLPARPGGTE